SIASTCRLSSSSSRGIRPCRVPKGAGSARWTAGASFRGTRHICICICICTPLYPRQILWIQVAETLHIAIN
ncbi:hypothetical protein P171DRAFT_400270, partial [Karstenula rhodostoma CBS 690.94]